MHNTEHYAFRQLGFSTFTTVTLDRLQPDPSFQDFFIQIPGTVWGEKKNLKYNLIQTAR